MSRWLKLRTGTNKFLPMAKHLRRLRGDMRPICNCGAYAFPHKLGGGRCDGSTFAEHYHLHQRNGCEFCNLNHNSTCDAITGQEHIKYGDCYTDALYNGPGYHVPLEYIPDEEEEQ